MHARMHARWRAARRCRIVIGPFPSGRPGGRPVGWPAMSSAPDPKLMDRVVNLAKRRGLVFPSSEIYGGFRSTWDYGPLGVLLKRNVKDAWWRSMVQLPRRRRRPRRRDPHGAQGVGGERPRRDVHRSAGRLPQLPGALPRRPPGPVEGVPQLRRQGQLHRGAPLQPDVQDVRRPGGRRRDRSRTCGPRPRRASS